MDCPEKIGLFGGTFNPVHMGHLMIAEYAFNEYGLDKIFFIPAHIPPHKRTEADKAQILADDLRMAMVEAAVSDVPYFIPCDCEIKKQGISYTSDTLEGFMSMFPKAVFYLIMGGDSLMAIETWHCPEKILKGAHLLVAARDDDDLKRLEKQAADLEEKYGNTHICLLHAPRVEISSTDIRARVLNGDSIRYLVPESVRDYIQTNKLYLASEESGDKPMQMDRMNILEIQNQLRKKQTERRFLHILGVQYTSASLAMRYGADMHKASMAGLLHDCAKHMTADKLIKICERHNIEITEAEHKSPYLLHAKVGAYLASAKYGICDEDILNAICCHTTGKPAMTLLEKIVFVADYIEPSRNQAPNLEQLRKVSFENIDEAVYLILKQTLAYLYHKNQAVDAQTEVTFNYYKDLVRRDADE